MRISTRSWPACVCTSEAYLAACCAAAMWSILILIPVSLVKRWPISASFLSESGAKLFQQRYEISRCWPRAGGTPAARIPARPALVVARNCRRVGESILPPVRAVRPEQKMMRAVGRQTIGPGASLSRNCTRSGHMRRSGMLRVEDAKATEELQRRSIVERLMGPDGVVRLLPGAELGIERVQMPVTVGHLVELLGVSALGAFHGAIELRTPRRQDEQPDAGPLTGLFE